MIQWVRDIDSEDKLRIYQTIDNLCFVEPDFSGGFSDIYIVGNYAIKKTVYNPIDDVIDHPDAGVDDSGDPIECIVQSDKYLLNQMKDHKNFPVFYGYTGNLDPDKDCVNEDIVIMEYLSGQNLDEILSKCNSPKEKASLISKLSGLIKKALVDIINAGWYPVDFRFRCIYPQGEKDNFKLIDYNLYQCIDYMKSHGSTIDFSDPFRLASKIWESVLEYEPNKKFPYSFVV